MSIELDRSGQPIVRVLFVGFNRLYVNRTVSVLLRAIQAACDLHFFGPGYQHADLVEAGAEAWVKRHGPFDLILFDSYLAEFHEVGRRSRPFAGDVIQFDPREFYKHGEGLRHFVQRYSGTKVFIVNWDVYGLGSDKVEWLEDSGALVMDYSMARLTIRQKEAAFGASIADVRISKGAWGRLGTDEWVSYLNRNRSRVLEVPHAIGLEQTSYISHARRTQLLTIPGARYEERRRLYALQSLPQRFRRGSDRLEDRVYAAMNDRLTSRRMHTLHSRYDMDIANSRFAFVSGSAHRSPVRKYFEIPALGATPVGHECEGFAALGFSHGQTFVVAETETEVREVLRTYSVEASEKIGAAARRLIVRRHSELARSLQLQESFVRIARGEFHGSYWAEGEYHHRPAAR